jgi:hypothetical protein
MGNDDGDHATAKRRARQSTSKNREALEANCQTYREESSSVAEFAGRFLTRGSWSDLRLFDDSALIAGSF